ncbi:MAG: hypothetical protein O3B47_02610 [bacterium]|nr:hypothetical protein [bacterium]
MNKLVFPIVCALILAGCGSAGTGDNVAVEQSEPTLICNNGFSEYQVDGTSIQFCYDPAWGDVVVENLEALEGELHRVSFADLAGGPEIWYETSDFVGVGGDVYHIPFKEIRITASSENLKTQFIEELNYPFAEDEFKLRKSDIGGKKAIRVHVDASNDFFGDVDYVSFIIPSAFEGHNVTITANQDYAFELDDFAWNVLF